MLLLSLSACSWNEYFVIQNSSSTEATVSYSIAEKSSGFPLFDHQATLYKLTKTNKIDWNSRQIAADIDTSLTGVNVKVPANYALIIGVLSNDHYSSHDQKFINDRFFNLKKLEISTNKDTLKILPENFDSYFKRSNGAISHLVK